jgi:ubiquitin C-terminal hydrolase
MSNELIVPTFGFINNGNICYFNSLIQSIINCKHIMHYLINEQQPKNELQKYFKNKFINLIELYNNEDVDKFKEESSVLSLEILKILLNKHKKYNINEQQSSSEFFLYLIEELDIEHFFKIKHQINIHCGNCKNISSKFDECYHYEMFCNDIKENKIDIDDFMYSVNLIQDYKCDKCMKVSKSMYEKVAINISRYFVIILNKYFNKELIEYPNTFQITVKNKQQENKNSQNQIDNYIPQSCLWENIGQIEHIGHLNSGHYISICKRLNNIFLFDDMNVIMTEHKKLHPSKNTYMVFYEKKY